VERGDRHKKLAKSIFQKESSTKNLNIEECHTPKQNKNNSNVLTTKPRLRLSNSEDQNHIPIEPLDFINNNHSNGPRTPIIDDYSIPLNNNFTYDKDRGTPISENRKNSKKSLNLKISTEKVSGKNKKLSKGLKLDESNQKSQKKTSEPLIRHPIVLVDDEDEEPDFDGALSSSPIQSKNFENLNLKIIEGNNNKQQRSQSSSQQQVSYPIVPIDDISDDENMDMVTPVKKEMKQKKFQRQSEPEVSYPIVPIDDEENDDDIWETPIVENKINKHFLNLKLTDDNKKFKII